MRKFAPLALLLLALVPLRPVAQTVDAQPDLGLPMVTFELNWRDADPHWYSVSIDSTARASYQSEPHVAPGETPGVTFLVKFTATTATRDKVFQLAEELNEFQNANYDAGGQVAQTGIKTLRWQDASHNFQASYNGSKNPKVIELTSIFQRISITMEEGRRLADKLSFDRLDLDHELQRAEKMYNQHQLLELQALQPTLQNIANNPGILASSRYRARKLLAAVERAAGK